MNNAFWMSGLTMPVSMDGVRSQPNICTHKPEHIWPLYPRKSPPLTALQSPLMCVQGHFQIILNPRRTPLFQWKLRLFDRLMYCSGCWSYTVGAITTPVFIAIPFLTIWIGGCPGRTSQKD